jgi:acetyltransferase-like isoleucine patch superfamily enzyme
MTSSDPRLVHAVHGLKPVERDPDAELALSAQLRESNSRDELLQLASHHAIGDSDRDARMRRAVWRALAHTFGHGVRIGRGAIASHLETFEIGDGVFIGEQAFIQGRVDGRCVIGDYVWLGPQSYLDARDLVIEDYVGWGPAPGRSARSTRVGLPTCRLSRRILKSSRRASTPGRTLVSMR